jgi:hypothetical protein
MRHISTIRKNPVRYCMCEYVLAIDHSGPVLSLQNVEVLDSRNWNPSPDMKSRPPRNIIGKREARVTVA